MSVAYTSLVRIVTEADDLGVPAEPLAPMQTFIDRNNQLVGLLDSIEKRNHVAEAFENGGDLAAALKAEADDQAVYDRAHAHAVSLTNVVGGAMRDLVDDPARIDPFLAALSKINAPAQAALTKISDRWGDENPDANVVAAEATATELKAYQARPQHLRTRARVYAILEKLFDTTKGTTEGKFPIVTLPPGGTRDSMIRYWLTDYDGNIYSQQQIRAKVNAFRTLEELSRHDDILTAPKPPFIARYAVHPDRLATAVFDVTGAPVDPDSLMTAEEYYDLFGTKANDKDVAERDRDVEVTDAYRAELEKRKNN